LFGSIRGVVVRKGTVFIKGNKESLNSEDRLNGRVVSGSILSSKSVCRTLIIFK